jgi:HK97 family phage major capsid protein
MRHNIAGLRQARAKVSDDLSAITINATTSDADLAESERLTAEGQRLDRLIAAAESAQELAASTAREPATLNPRVPASAATPEEPGVGFAQITRAIVGARGRLDQAHAFAQRTWGESHPVTTELGAALVTNDAGSGGFLVPERFSQEIVDLLLPRTIIRRRVAAVGGVVPLVGGTDNIPTVESGINAYYIGEQQDATASEPTFGNIKATEREMVALDPYDGKTRTTIKLNGPAYLPPVVAGGMLYVLTDDGSLTAYR